MEYSTLSGMSLSPLPNKGSGNIAVERMQELVEGEESSEMLFSGHDMASALMNSMQSRSSAQDQVNKISQYSSRQH